jgi:hypothetical protein
MIDFKKPIQTRDGRAVTILSTEGRGLYTAIGYIGDCSSLETWTPMGRVSLTGGQQDTDLINVPGKCVRYLNLYEGYMLCHTYPSRAEADKYCASDRIACIRIEYTEGQFDE